MAANLQLKKAIGFGKRISDHCVPAGAGARRPAPVSTAARRGLHGSVYDKNPDDHVRPALVPDDVIQPQPGKYWGPHPSTGVFGPADQNARPDPSATASSPGNGGSTSALDQTAWFRPLEDVEKPPLA